MTEIGKMFLSGLGRRGRARKALLERLNDLDAFLQQLVWRVRTGAKGDGSSDIGEATDRYVELVARIRSAAADPDELVRKLAAELRAVSVPFVRVLRVGGELSKDEASLRPPGFVVRDMAFRAEYLLIPWWRFLLRWRAKQWKTRYSLPWPDSQH